MSLCKHLHVVWRSSRDDIWRWTQDKTVIALKTSPYGFHTRSETWCNHIVLCNARHKLSSLCSEQERNVCKQKHAKQFVGCRGNVVYKIPFTCGRCYIGQTGRCINERLREHAYSLKGSVSSHLVDHCRKCDCEPIFKDCEILGTYAQQRQREIFEAFCIQISGECCVSAASLSLRKNDMLYLSKRWFGNVTAISCSPMYILIVFPLYILTCKRNKIWLLVSAVFVSSRLRPCSSAVSSFKKQYVPNSPFQDVNT